MSARGVRSAAGAEATTTHQAGTHHADTGRGTSSGRSWAAVAALALGIFVLVTIEELPIGVLAVMAPDLGVSAGVAGLTVTVPGVLAALVALLTPRLTRDLDRRTVLLMALLAVILSCTASMLAPGILSLLAARTLAGIAIGLYWAVLPMVAVRQVPAGAEARALTLSFAGVGGALVLGVPLAAWIGTRLGWRDSFAAVGALALLVLLLVLLLVRPVRTASDGPRGMRAALRTRPVRFALVLTAVIITGQFVTYSYVSPLLVHVAHVPVTALSALLLAFGVSGLIGNFAITPVLTRSPGTAVLLVASGIALALLTLLLVVRGPLAAALVMPLWGLFAGAASVSNQTFVTREAAEHEEEATALNSAVFNVSISAGALLGGRVVDSAGPSAAVVVSLLLMAIGIAVALRWLIAPARAR